MKTIIQFLIILIISTTMKAQTVSDSIVEKVNKERTFFETLGEIYPVNQNVKITEITFNKVKCYWLTPNKISSDNIVIYLHGGSFGLGSINSHKAMVSQIAETAQSKILFIEYSLAPEHPFPIAVNEIAKVYKALLENYPKSKIIFMGDSAGGGLVVSSIHSIISNKLNLPSAVILISPWLNLKCNTNSYKTRQSLDPILTKQSLLEYAKYYSGNAESADPNEMIFNSFPPAFLLTGANEVLYDDSKNFFDYIRTIQHNTTFKEYSDQTHVWLLTSINSEKSKEALNDIGIFISNYR